MILIQVQINKNNPLIKGVAECGLSVASKGIFQNGSFDLIDYFYKRCNSQMAEYLENLVKEGKVTKKNELVRSAILFRLSLIQPYIQHWPKVQIYFSKILLES